MLIHPWEIHPALVHFPIAFLTGGVLLDLFAWRRSRPDLTRVATATILTGVATGWLAGLAGFLAYFTIPAHTAAAHDLLIAHLILNVAGLALFSAIGYGRARGAGGTTPTLRTLGAFTLAGVLVSSALGGWAVYRGAAGIEPDVLSPELRASHAHAHEHTEEMHP